MGDVLCTIIVWLAAVATLISASMSASIYSATSSLGVICKLTLNMQYYGE